MISAGSFRYLPQEPIAEPSPKQLNQNTAQRQHQRAAGARHDLREGEELHALRTAKNSDVAGAAHVGGAHACRDVKNEKALFIHESVRCLHGALRDEAERADHGAAEDAGDRAAELGLNDGQRLAEGVQPLADHHEQQEAADNAVRDAADVHARIQKDQDGQIEREREARDLKSCQIARRCRIFQQLLQILRGILHPVPYRNANLRVLRIDHPRSRHGEADHRHQQAAAADYQNGVHDRVYQDECRNKEAPHD